MQPRCALRIDALQALVQALRPARLFGDGIQLLAQRAIGAVLAQIHLIAQRVQVQARAADEYRQPAAGKDAVDDARRHVAVHGNGEDLPWVGHVDHVMHRLRALLQRGLGRADVHAAVDLHGVHGDDFRTERIAQRDGRARLARARGADQRKHRGFHRMTPPVLSC